MKRTIFSLSLLTSCLMAPCLMTPAQAEDLEQTQQLITTKQCPQCNLSGAGLVYMDLSGADLQGANLSQANLSRVNLSNANLKGANLAGAVLFSANLSGANLEGANLSGADLRGATLSSAVWQNVQTDGANFLGAIDLPTEVATAENLYIWGLTESQRNNFPEAIDYYNQAIELKPEFSHAYLARGLARFQTGDTEGALQDGERAKGLYLTETNDAGHQASIQFIEGIQAYQEARAEEAKGGGGGGGGGFLGFLGSVTGLLMRFLPLF